MGFFTRKSAEPQAEPDLVALSEQADEVQAQLAELENFVEEAPVRAQEEFDERYATMPPPDELEDRRRERRFHAKLSRNELRNEKRYQAKSGLMIVLLILATGAMLAWAWKIAQQGL